MSLIAWYPLNGNTKNHGLHDFADGIILNSLASDSNGKIGATYSWTTDGQGIRVANGMNFLKPLAKYSMACWVYFTGDGTYNTKIALISSGNYNYSFMDFGIKNRNIITVPGSACYDGLTLSTTLSLNTWYHIAIACDGAATSIYVNGVLQGSVSYKGITQASETNDFYIGASTYYNGFTHRGKINDVRIYDHCLSPKEVKGISQCLVLHYPMNEIDGVSGGRNLFIKNQAEYYSVNSYSWDDFVFSAVIPGSGGIKIPLSYFTAGQTYTLSFKFRKTSGTLSTIGGHSYGFTCSSFTVDGVNTGVVFHDGYALSNDTQVHVVSTTLTYNGGSDDDNLYIQINRNVVATCGYDLWDIKLETGGSATPWTPAPEDTGTNDDSTVYDCSGYGNNGSAPSGKNPVWSSDAKIGQGSYKFSGSQYLVAPRTAMVKDDITVSVWAYMSNWADFATNDMRLISCTESGGWNFEPINSAYMNFAMGTGTSSCTYKSAASTTALSALSSGWHLFTGTYDGFTTKIYIDGVLENSNSAYSTKTPIYYNSSNAIFIGAEATSSATIPDSLYFNGLIQDVRIYATALSESDIKELYSTRFSLADDGTFFCGKYVEDDVLSVGFNASGVLGAASMNENASLYDMPIKILDDGSCWARVFHHNNKAGTTMFKSTDDFANSAVIHDKDRYSRLNLVANCRTNGVYEFMMDISEDSRTPWRWTQTNNPVTSTSTGTVVHSDGNGDNFGLVRCSGNTFLARTTSTGNWWVAVGCYTPYEGGIPGVFSQVITGTMDLWVRIDGSELLGLPYGYQQLEYIESNNGAQYINTGFSTTTGMICEYEAMFLDTTGGYIAGSHNIASPYGRNGCYWSQRTQWEFGYGETCPGFGSGTINTKYHVKFSTTTDGAYLSVDGTTLTTGSGQSTSGTPVYLLTNQYSITNGGAATNARVYFVKIWDSSGNLVRDFIPCRNSSGTLGFYDMVHGVFYTNDGTGVFTSGPSVTSISSSATQTQVFSNAVVAKQLIEN